MPHDVKAARLRQVIALQEEHTRAAHTAQIGRPVQVLVNGPARRGDRIFGRSRHGFNTLLPHGCGTKSQLTDAVVTASTGHSLFAEPVATHTASLEQAER